MLKLNFQSGEFEDVPRGMFIAPWIIPAVITAVGIGAQALGANKQAQAEEDAARQRNASLQRFTGLQAHEFDTRMRDQGESRDRINAIKDESFRNQTGLSTANLAETLAMRKKYDNWGTNAKLGVYDRIAGFNAERNDVRDRVFTQLGDISTAETARQNEFQAQGTKVADDIVKRMGLGPVNADVAQTSGARRALLDSAITGGGSNLPPGQSDYGAADLARRVSERVGMVRGRAEGLADVAAVNDAGSLADRLVNRAGQRIDILSRAAKGSREAMDPEVAAAQKEREVADQDATLRTQNAQKDVEDYMTRLAQGQTMEGARVKERQDAVADLMDKFYAGEIKTEEDFIQAITASSLNYEDALQALFNFQIGGTYGKSTFGQFLSGAGGTLAGAGINRLASI